MKKILFTIFILCFFCLTVAFGQIKVNELHGDELYSYRNFHSGNQIRTSFIMKVSSGIGTLSIPMISASGRLIPDTIILI